VDGAVWSGERQCAVAWVEREPPAGVVDEVVVAVTQGHEVVEVVGPSSSQNQMWWTSHQSNGVVQPSMARVRWIARSARRCSRVAVRCARRR